MGARVPLPPPGLRPVDEPMTFEPGANLSPYFDRPYVLNGVEVFPSSLTNEERALVRAAVAAQRSRRRRPRLSLRRVWIAILYATLRLFGGARRRGGA